MYCHKCSKEFPTRVVVDGRVRHLGNRRYCLGCSPFGTNNRRRLEASGDGRGEYRHADATELTCRACQDTKPVKEFYLKKSWWFSYCKACIKANSLRYHHLFKARAIEYKGGLCLDCGQMPHPAAMHFHHRDPGVKDIEVSKLRASKFEKVLAEIDKCDLLCANCHAIRHAGSSWT